jgi:DNA-directed RNA polymerase subunit H
MSDDDIISDIGTNDYIRLDSITNTTKEKNVYLILAADGKYSLHGPDLRKLCQPMQIEKITRIVLIVSQEFTEKKNVMSIVNEMKSDFPIVKVYKTHNFPYDIRKSAVIPKHEIMTVEEATAMLNQYNMPWTSLPPISVNETAMIWCDAKVDDIIKITRTSETAGLSLYYRRVEDI